MDKNNQNNNTHSNNDKHTQHQINNDMVNITVPGTPLITLQPKSQSAILYWLRPKSSEPIFEYSIIVESENFPEKVRINTYNDSTSIKCEYELFNIINFASMQLI